ncbi:MAG: DUF4199 domain-containing protein [Bacteroidetes bacterium]|jgi:hypothetical protein|nr:DUF4199 domain-containing protein [Bacteroidota bacterium]MBT6687239.1 DUF4199 domain-containing protein [Bacteroidota bacterium]MBT7144012.1 DUF4199 domain-containing protein [Bacteroidota bacterium]MBT7493171.1 DUF4199 domain-containing protein [Bacteroidota bacterium]
MENQKVSNIKPSMNLGAILGLVLICYSIVLYMLDMNLNPKMQYLSYAVIAATLYLTMKSYRDNYQKGFITYSKALGTGTLISFFASILNAFYVYIFHTVIDTEAIQKMKDMQIEELLNNGMSEDDVEMIISTSQVWMTPLVFTITTIIGVTFIGFILSLLISIFIKKEGDPFIEDMAEIE